MAEIAPVISLDRTAVVTLCSSARVDHLREQLKVTRASGAHTIIVWLGDDEAPDLGADVTVRVAPGEHGFRLAAGRNAGASQALFDGAELIVFLDADCVPGPELLARYRAGTEAIPDAVLCGPVTYLPDGFGSLDPRHLSAATAPHPARPAPAAGVNQRATPDEYDLFWSLSFAITPAAWAASGGFDERFEGYGGEDTDFGRRLRRHGIPLVWVGGAHAYHQYHPTSTPPVQHLDDILRNGELFASVWGHWPMGGWLAAFEREGLVERTVSGWRRTAPTL